MLWRRRCGRAVLAPGVACPAAGLPRLSDVAWPGRPVWTDYLLLGRGGQEGGGTVCAWTGPGQFDIGNVGGRTRSPIPRLPRYFDASHLHRPQRPGMDPVYGEGECQRKGGVALC